MGLVLLVVLGIIAIIVLNILKAQGVSLPGVRAARGAVVCRRVLRRGAAWGCVAQLGGGACSGCGWAVAGGVLVGCWRSRDGRAHAALAAPPHRRPTCRAGGGCCGSHPRGGDGALAIKNSNLCTSPNCLTALAPSPAPTVLYAYSSAAALSVCLPVPLAAPSAPNLAP